MNNQKQIIIELVLENNVFEFNETFYIQKQGTAMGTKMAPSYANLFMGKLEESLKHKHIHTWKRYIDDIIIHHLENSFHPTIKFTYESSQNELTFLDTTIYKGERFKLEKKLDIRTHIKKKANNYTYTKNHTTPNQSKRPAQTKT